MEKIIILTMFIFTQNIAYFKPCYGQLNLDWAKNISGTEQEVGKSIALDNLGNVLVAGYFTGTVDFDPSAAVYNMTSQGQQDIFISKLDVNGNFVWAKRIGGTGNDMAYSLAADAIGNVYATGYFQHLVDFNPGLGVFNIAAFSTGSQDIFILKLDSAGNFQWAKSFGGSGYYDSLNNLYDAVSTGYAIHVDGNGNIYTTGSFLGTIDFNPGPGIDNMASSSVANIFISKLNSDGEFVWARQMGENKHGDEAYSICVDTIGNIYTSGTFSDTADFDPGPAQFHLICNAYNKAFLSKLDSTGNFVWAKEFGGESSTDQTVGYCVRIDANDHILVEGQFKGSGDFDPGMGIHNLYASGNYDIFICKLNATGDFLWGRSFGGMNSEYCYAVSTDFNGSIYMTGSFKGLVDFDPGIDSTILSSTNLFSTDIFISKLNSSGNFVWATKLGGNSNDLAHSIKLDNMENIFMTGNFSGQADFNPANDVFNLISSGSIDAFILKLNQNNMILPLSFTSFSGIETGAGNLLKWEVENEMNTSHTIIEKAYDGKGFNRIGLVECHVNTYTKTTYHFIDQHPFVGRNYYRLKLVDVDGQYTYSNMISILHNEPELPLIVFPNPSRGQISIFINTYITNGVLKIKDANGQLIEERNTINGQSFTLNIAAYANGHYFIEIEEKDNRIIPVRKTNINRTKVQLLK